jgi:hypothetical protein
MATALVSSIRITRNVLATNVLLRMASLLFVVC